MIAEILYLPQMLQALVSVRKMGAKLQLDYDYTLLLMIFIRMTGCIMLNPIFGRRNIPMIAKVGLTLILTLFVYSVIPDTQSIQISSVAVFGIVMVKEFIIGFIIGFIINLFLSTLILAGEFMDVQIGISMSKIYDPASNVSMPISASILNAMLMIIFFLANGHLTLIEVFVHSSHSIPYGDLVIADSVFKDLALMFSSILVYAIKMSMPVLAAQIITEMGVGIIMKAVPQINVFVINLQLKIAIGFIMIFLLVPSFASFIDKIFIIMFDNINRIMGLMV